MVKKLDFNALEKPVLEITLKDEAKTAVRVTAPTEEMVERFMSLSENIKTLTNGNNGETLQKAFELIAALINNNLDGQTFTADSLRKQYGFRLYEAIVFVKVYLEFIKELENAKN